MTIVSNRRPVYRGLARNQGESRVDYETRVFSHVSTFNTSLAKWDLEHNRPVFNKPAREQGESLTAYQQRVTPLHRAFDKELRAWLSEAE